jgi:hypothetical protein
VTDSWLVGHGAGDRGTVVCTGPEFGAEGVPDVTVGPVAGVSVPGVVAADVAGPAAEVEVLAKVVGVVDAWCADQQPAQATAAPTRNQVQRFI